MNAVNVSRGRDVRRALLAVARACHARNLLLPSYACLGRTIGLSGSQICRHMGRLLDEGAIDISQAGRRFRIKSIRP